MNASLIDKVNLTTSNFGYSFVEYADMYFMGKQKSTRLTFADFVDKIFWVVVIGIGTYAASQLSALSNSIQGLGQAVTSLSTKDELTQEKLRDIKQKNMELETRVRALEISTNVTK